MMKYAVVSYDSKDDHFLYAEFLFDILMKNPDRFLSLQHILRVCINPYLGKLDGKKESDDDGQKNDQLGPVNGKLNKFHNGFFHRISFLFCLNAFLPYRSVARFP